MASINLRIGQYRVLETIGVGSFGKVKRKLIGEIKHFLKLYLREIMANSCRPGTIGAEGGTQVCESQAHIVDGLDGRENEARNTVPQVSAPSAHY
jgi:hypothetical protein